MSNKFWTVIGSIAGVVAVILTVWLFLQGRSDQSKKLEVELIARSTLVDENVTRTKQRIEILYDGRKIPNYTILQFRVVNTGGQPIRSTDYEEHFRLRFANVAEILSIEQVSANPKQLQVTPSVENPSSVLFPTILLNPSDWFILEVSIAPETRKKLTTEVTGRIAGVKQIEFKEAIAPPSNLTILNKLGRWLDIFQIALISSAITIFLMSIYFRIKYYEAERIRLQMQSRENK
jgi:hypothetical protein